jgi:hypothetical protein
MLRPPRSGTASAVEDALAVGITIYVGENEALRDALRRFHDKSRYRNKGPFRWMREASSAKAKKKYHLKSSFLKRMKRVKKKFLAQKRPYCFEGGPPPD